MVSERKQELRQTVLKAAENIIASRGLGAIKARDIAKSAGCALGTIYTVFEDLDDLVLAVNNQTLERLEQTLAACPRPLDAGQQGMIDWLISLSMAYIDFAAENRMLWLALFEFRMSVEQRNSELRIEKNQALFRFIERPLEQLSIEPDAEARMLLARSLFSAVHGMVTLGLEEKLVYMSRDVLKEQVILIVSACLQGLLAKTA